MLIVRHLVTAISVYFNGCHWMRYPDQWFLLVFIQSHTQEYSRLVYDKSYRVDRPLDRLTTYLLLGPSVSHPCTVVVTSLAKNSIPKKICRATMASEHQATSVLPNVVINFVHTLIPRSQSKVLFNFQLFSKPVLITRQMIQVVSFCSSTNFLYFHE